MWLQVYRHCSASVYTEQSCSHCIPSPSTPSNLRASPLLLHIYKTLNDLSPMYLSDCLTLYVPLREGLRSSLDTTRLIIPRSRRLIGDRSFSVRGPKLWNVTPHHIRLSSTVATFKQNLKTYLY